MQWTLQKYLITGSLVLSAVFAIPGLTAGMAGWHILILALLGALTGLLAIKPSERAIALLATLALAVVSGLIAFEALAAVGGFIQAFFANLTVVAAVMAVITALWAFWDLKK